MNDYSSTANSGLGSTFFIEQLASVTPPFVITDEKTGEAVSKDLYVADQNYREEIKRLRNKHRIKFQNAFTSRGLAVPTYNTPIEGR